MDVTGHGLRCPRCSAAAALRPGDDMSEHLTPDELEAVGRRAHTELVGGAFLAGGALVATVISFALATRTVVIFGGAFVAGIGLAFHGLSVKRQVARSQRSFPRARVHSP
jgi:hypothetical protein